MKMNSSQQGEFVTSEQTQWTRATEDKPFHIWPINPVVYWEPYPIKWEGALISKQASRLDAFSGYPFRT